MESSKTGGDAPTEPAAPAQPKRVRKPRAQTANAFDDFVNAVRPELSEALGSDRAASNVIDDPALGVVFRTWFNLRRTVSNAARKCRETLVNMLAVEQVEYRMKRDAAAVVEKVPQL